MAGSYVQPWMETTRESWDEANIVWYQEFRLKSAAHPLPAHHQRVLRAIEQCRTAELGGIQGWVAVLHTWNQKLLQHLHLHCPVPGGALAFDHSRWIVTGPDFLFRVEPLGQKFQGHFFAQLKIAYRDGTYNWPPRFKRVRAPDISELKNLVQLISQRVGRCLERQGLLEQDAEQAWLDLDPADDTDAMPHLLGSSVSYRIAAGPQQGQKAFMIRTIQPLDRPDPGLERVAKANGFSLHAGVSCEVRQRGKRERLCRYIARPAVAIPRLSLNLGKRFTLL